MKTLWILRHAHANVGPSGTDDHERPLSDRGREEALRAGRVLRASEDAPESILGSTAARARETALGVSRELGEAVELRFDERLYLADPETMTELLAGVANEIESVLVVAHNPGLEALAASLAGSRVGLPPAGLVEIELPIEAWEDLYALPTGRLRRRWTPAEADRG